MTIGTEGIFENALAVFSQSRCMPGGIMVNVPCVADMAVQAFIALSRVPAVPKGKECGFARCGIAVNDGRRPIVTAITGDWSAAPGWRSAAMAGCAAGTGENLNLFIYMTGGHVIAIAMAV
jgi:hypothetical protein